MGAGPAAGAAVSAGSGCFSGVRSGWGSGSGVVAAAGGAWTGERRRSLPRPRSESLLEADLAAGESGQPATDG